MAISNKYVLVSKIEEEKADGFQAVAIEDSSIYMGIIKDIADQPIWIGNRQLVIGDKIIFAKYSPNTHLITRNGEELKYILIDDILEVL